MEQKINIELNEIEHNIKDHIKATWNIIYENGATGKAKEMLLKHILTEERINQQRLLNFLNHVTIPKTEANLTILLDHSKILTKIIEGKDIKPELGKELLHHFLEEHINYEHQSGPISNNKEITNSKNSKNYSSQLTVGSLIEK